MKKKIFDTLKSKYTHVGVSDKAFDRVASYLEKMVTAESSDEDFNKVIEGAETLLIGFKAESDSKLEDHKKKNPTEKLKTEPVIKQEENTEKKPAEQSEEMPAWAKAVIESNQNIAKELAGIKTSSVAQSRKQVLEQKLKDVPEKLKAKAIKDFERMQFDNDESFNTYVDETEADLKDIVQVDKEQSVGANSTPLLSSGGGKLGDAEVSPMMKAFITNRTKTVEAAQPAKAV